MIHADTRAYNAALPAAERAIAKLLATTISEQLPDAENKVWHRHPVWFLDGIRSSVTASSRIACA